MPAKSRKSAQTAAPAQTTAVAGSSSSTTARPIPPTTTPADPPSDATETDDVVATTTAPVTEPPADDSAPAPGDGDDVADDGTGGRSNVGKGGRGGRGGKGGKGRGGKAGGTAKEKAKAAGKKGKGKEKEPDQEGGEGEEDGEDSGDDAPPSKKKRLSLGYSTPSQIEILKKSMEGGGVLEGIPTAQQAVTYSGFHLGLESKRLQLEAKNLEFATTKGLKGTLLNARSNLVLSGALAALRPDLADNPTYLEVLAEAEDIKSKAKQLEEEIDSVEGAD